MAILSRQICDTLYIAFTIPSEGISLSDLLHSSNIPGQIYSDMDAIFIEDATSQICVNDNKILIHQLKEGDIIRINEKLLTFSREKITFSSSYENKWLCVRDVWSRSNSISIGGRGTTGEIELDSLCISCIFENYRDFPEEYLYEGLMDKSIIVAGYSLLILLYRNSSLLSNSDEWQKPREETLSYSHGCTSSGYKIRMNPFFYYRV